MFDAFAKKTLLQYGSNSEVVLRTIYRQLSEDFLTIVQDSSAVDKIVKNIQSKSPVENESQSSTPVSVDSEPKQSSPDINSVVLDFLDELQTSIL